MVCFDKDLTKAMEFTNKFGVWDEVSLGGRYQNEMALRLLNVSDIPGTPHIIMTNEIHQPGERFKSVPVVKEEVILIDKIGTNDILKWINEIVK